MKINFSEKELTVIYYALSRVYSTVPVENDNHAGEIAFHTCVKLKEHLGLKVFQDTEKLFTEEHKHLSFKPEVIVK